MEKVKLFIIMGMFIREIFKMDKEWGMARIYLTAFIGMKEIGKITISKVKENSIGIASFSLRDGSKTD